jgi:Arc/MetJ family transcription regulator
MKRINLVLDEALVPEALKAAGLKTRRALAQQALQELVRRENTPAGLPSGASFR